VDTFFKKRSHVIMNDDIKNRRENGHGLMLTYVTLNGHSVFAQTYKGKIVWPDEHNIHQF